MDKYEAYEKYAEYEELYGQDGNGGRHAGGHNASGRQAHRRKPAKQTTKKPSATEVRAQLTDFSEDIADFVPTYAAALDPKHFERKWLVEQVKPYYQQEMITDVVRRVKGGKEANVYCCTAHPATGLDYVAAKLYRPRTLRHLKNDAVYKAGRQLADAEGREIKDRRVKLALKQKTRFGRQVDIAWWIGNEYGAQSRLYQVGADVPRPIAHSGDSILMEYIGDEDMPAPTLIDVSLSPNEAQRLFKRVLDNVALMLDNHLVHGDLSAYNILYADGAIKIIDFPQMVGARTNPHAFELLRRDIRRVCDYFGRYGVRSEPERLSADLWLPYMGSLE
jgi:RIO kinase 1